jgi:hypothetical protein
MDCWQMALEDVGPAGVDKGKGGKYLILPPDYKDQVPDGYIPLASGTFKGYALLRSILKSGTDEDVAQAVEYARRIQFYPLSQTKPGPTVFVDAIDAEFDSTITYDQRFFESLARMVESEPWLTRDKVMIDVLKSLGIEKGKSFKPDPATQEILKGAAADAQALLGARYDSSFTPFYEGRQWAMPASHEFVEAVQGGFTDPVGYPVDSRGLVFTYAFFTAKHLGAGQYYLMTIKDKAGQPFDGASTYRLTVPANAPVKQYWSATAYDRATHALIRDQPRASRSSQNLDLQKNADGSVDVYFGPKAPAAKESNWVPTDPNGGFEVLFRLYGPEKALFDKTWKLPDIEKTT